MNALLLKYRQSGRQAGIEESLKAKSDAAASYNGVIMCNYCGVNYINIHGFIRAQYVVE